MTFADKEKLASLRKTLDINYQVTNLYARYIGNFPELIKKDMVDTLVSDCDITRTEAVASLMSEIFGLDIDNDKEGANDKKIILDYIYPSIRFPIAADYTENPYYKNIAPKETVKDGSWEIKWEYYPPYRAAIADDMIIKENFAEIPPIGFFEEGFSFPAVLEDGNEWMTLTPVDVDTCAEQIKKAHGKVVTFGLGLGYFTYMVSEKDDVESVTVVEKSENVIRLFEKHILPNFSKKEKVRIINADAFEYAENIMPSEKFDYAFVDTWRDASDGLPMYEKMKSLEHLSQKTEFDYWIENFIISRKRALRFEELWELCESNSDSAPKSYREFIERWLA